MAGSGKQQIALFLSIVFSVLALGNIIVWHEINNIKNNKELKFAMLDIGQGDSIFIEAPNGNQILIDGGPDMKTLSELGKVLSIGDRKIDVLLVTNPDKDHIAGFVPVLQKFKTDYILEPGTENKSEINVLLKKKESEIGAKTLIAKRGMKIILDNKNKVFIDILFPDRDVSDWSPNDGSIVSKLYYGKTSVMLSGDAPEETEKYLAKNYANDLKSDILKVGHHGSRTSTSEEFLNKVMPDLALISAGKENSYGHPHKEVLDRLKLFEITNFATKDTGTILLKSDGEKWSGKLVRSLSFKNKIKEKCVSNNCKR